MANNQNRREQRRFALDSFYNPLRSKYRIVIGDNIGFVLPGYQPTATDVLTPYHRFGTVIAIIWHRRGQYRSKQNPLAPVGFDVLLSEPMHTAFNPPPPVHQWQRQYPNPPDSVITVFVRYEDICQDNVTMIGEAGKERPSVVRPPLKYGIGAKLRVVPFGLESDYDTCVVTVVGMIHRRREREFKYGRCYQVISNDLLWPHTHCRPQGFTEDHIPIYNIPLHWIIDGKHDGSEHSDKITMILKLKQLWSRLEFLRVFNVVTKAFSTHNNGNRTKDCVGTQYVRAEVGNNGQLNYNIIIDKADTKTSLLEKNSFSLTDVDKNKGDDEQKENGLNNLWRFYHGFTDPPEGKENGIYFDVRGYAELDLEHGSLCLQRQYRKMGYPIPKVGDWLCGIAGKNRGGPHLKVWFVCSPQLRKLIEYVQSDGRRPPNINELRTNASLRELTMALKKQQKQKQTDAKAMQSLIDKFNEIVVMPNTESSSWPPFHDVVITLFNIIQHGSTTPYNNFNPNNMPTTHNDFNPNEMPNLVRKVYDQYFWWQK